MRGPTSAGGSKFGPSSVKGASLELRSTDRRDRGLGKGLQNGSSTWCRRSGPLTCVSWLETVAGSILKSSMARAVVACVRVEVELRMWLGDSKDGERTREWRCHCCVGGYVATRHRHILYTQTWNIASHRNLARHKPFYCANKRLDIMSMEAKNQRSSRSLDRP